MTIPVKVWIKYRDTLAKINRKAFDDMSEFLERIGGYGGHEAEVIDFAYALATKYGEATGALACEMYDAVARASGVNVPPAVPAETATYAETAKAVRGTAKRSETMIQQTVSRLSKQAGADTTLKNAARDKAQFAWIPSGDTCAFCRMLASRGWQNQSKKTLRNGHAEHIHANCDCEYAISFRGGEEYAAFYNPEQYLAEYYEAMDRSESGDWKGALNTMRREHYAKNKDMINAQKKVAYDKRQERRLREDEGVFMTFDARGGDGQNDIIKPHNIIKNMTKTSVGKKALKLVEDEGYSVKLFYGTDFQNENGTLLNGYCDKRDKEIGIFVDTLKDIQSVSEIVIHEANHIHDFGPCQKSEILCIVKEMRHRKKGLPLTKKEVDDIIINVKRLYPELPWEVE